MDTHCGVSWSWGGAYDPYLGKGKVSHPDHRTMVLQQWCRVLLNEERHSTAMGKVVFLD